jgi:hypothetical protein
MGYKTNCISFLQKYGTQTQTIRIYFPGFCFPPGGCMNFQCVHGLVSFAMACHSDAAPRLKAEGVERQRLKT